MSDEQEREEEGALGGRLPVPTTRNAKGEETLAEEPAPLPVCAGVTLKGEPCQAKFLRFVSDDGLRWCKAHAPEGATEERLYIGPPKETTPCAGVLRDDSPCQKRGTTTVTIAGEEKRLCGWHAQVWEQHHVLKPPPRRRKQVVTVDSEEIVEPEPVHLPLTPLPPEGAPEPDSNGSGPMTMRERVELSAESLYSDIEDGLRAALTNATRARKTRCPSCQEVFEVRLPDHGASISAAKALLDLVVSRPRQETEPSLDELGGEGFDPSTLSTAQLRRSLHLTEEDIIERLDEETLEERVQRVVDIAERFMADPRDVSPDEVREAKALLGPMTHYEHTLAPIRHLRVDWRGPREPESDIPPAPRYADE